MRRAPGSARGWPLAIWQTWFDCWLLGGGRSVCGCGAFFWFWRSISEKGEGVRKEVIGCDEEDNIELSS